MQKTRRLFLILGLIAITPASYVRAKMQLEVNAGTITGQVYEAINKKGIPGLTIRLIPPTALQKAEKITTTDTNGKFQFTGVEKGKYLIEIYYGLTILHRSIIDTTKDRTIEVALKRKGT